MCGIAGWFAFNTAPDPDKLRNAVAAIRHRGPDNQNVFADHLVGLGHARLSIIDLSTGAHQPMMSHDERYLIVFNGEIFNYQSLRNQLTEAGVQLHTTSDTEVLLNLYILMGRSCLPLLNGFFAFAIYDREDQSLFLARDRYGIKPLYLYQDDHGLRFGSEMGALMQMDVPRELNHEALYWYLRLNYLPPHTGMLKGVWQLKPGHFAYIQRKTILEEQWYSLPTEVKTPQPSYVNAQAELLGLLDDAVKLRLIADVPVGVFLSGGIDSSTVAALASRHTTQLQTFSIGFEDKLYDETPYAEAVARMYNTQHTVFKLKTSDLYDHLHDMLDSLQEPMADASALNFYILSKRTRERVTVALSGDGADELFGGYSKHVGEWYSRYGGLRNLMLRTGSPLLGMLPANRHSKWGRKLYQAQKYAQALRLPPAQRWLQWAAVADAPHTLDLLARPVQDDSVIAPYLEGFTPKGDLNEVFRADFGLVLAGDMLVKADRMSMAHALEVRVPFLDYRVVDYAMQLPQLYKVHHSQRKRILQDTLKPLLPPELYNRPKQGFEVPLRQWYLNELRPYIEQELLNEDYLRHQGIFRPEGLRHLWSTILAGRSTKEDWTLWAVIVFQRWYRREMEQA